MPTARFNGVVIAESDACEVVEGNQYFPKSSLRSEYFKPNPKTSFCPWKGTATYFDVVVDGEVAKGAAWTYAEPKTAAANIKDHVAFWNGVTVEV